jgi:2-desacetyl-2-hydroxyethyl bacteriochlorophyllide A dehydrogenase
MTTGPGEMRALWFVAPGRVEIRATPLPSPGPDEVRVRTTYSGISAGTELLAYRGQIDPELPLDETIGALGGTFRYPFRYGYSCVGVVEASAGALAEGTRVFSFQPHGERFVAPSDAVVALGRVGDREATMFPLVETALQISLDAGPVLDDRVVVFGLGAIGALTALVLGRAGARVIGVEPRAWRRELLAAMGVETAAPEELTARLRAGGEPGDVPLIIEASGNPDVLRAALPRLAHEGTALVASWYGTKDVTLPLGAEFHRRRLTLRSTQVSTIPAALSARWSPARRRAAVVALLDVLPLHDLATHTFAFDAAEEAFAAVDEGQEGLVHAALGYN